jgi:hypothetical protein
MGNEVTDSEPKYTSTSSKNIILTMYGIQRIVQLDILIRVEGRDRWTGEQLVVQIQR